MHNLHGLQSVEWQDSKDNELGWMRNDAFISRHYPDIYSGRFQNPTKVFPAEHRHVTHLELTCSISKVNAGC
jgi:hypothetical protein